LLNLTAYWATSQPLPVILKPTPHGIVADSAAVYAIAENRRQLSACIEQRATLTKIYESQQAQLTIYGIELAAADQEVRDLTERLNRTTERMNQQKRARWVYVAAGVVIGGVVTYYGMK